MNPTSTPLFLIAGGGDYPALVIEGARRAGVSRIVMAAFEGETQPESAPLVDEIEWMRVGQMGRLLEAGKKSGATRALMAGQIAPGNLFDLRPDFKALLMLAKLKRRNAETLFGAVAEELAKAGLELLSAMTFLDDHIAPLGSIAGPRLKPRALEDLEFGFRLAKESSRLDIGQTVVARRRWSKSRSPIRTCALMCRSSVLKPSKSPLRQASATSALKPGKPFSSTAQRSASSPKNSPSPSTDYENSSHRSRRRRPHGYQPRPPL
jgi:hypothetical protein